MSLMPKEPRTADEKRAKYGKIRALFFDMIMPVITGLFLVLAIFWPQTVFTSLAGAGGGVILIRFSTTRYQANSTREPGDWISLVGGIVLILLAVVRLVLLILHTVGVLPH